MKTISRDFVPKSNKFQLLKFAMPGKNPNALRVSKWYPADDQKTHFVRKNKTPKPTRLRPNITPGTVLILLSGRFRGKRVVFLR